MNCGCWQSIGACWEVNGSRETQCYRLCLSLARHRLWAVEGQQSSLGFRPFETNAETKKSLMWRKAHLWRIKKMRRSRRTVLCSRVTSSQKAFHFSYPGWKVGQLLDNLSYVALLFCDGVHLVNPIVFLGKITVFERDFVSLPVSSLEIWSTQLSFLIRRGLNVEIKSEVFFNRRDWKVQTLHDLKYHPCL